MQKLIQLFLLGTVLLGLPTLVQAQLTFTTNSGAITITGYNGFGSVTIPATINGYPVVNIGAGAFSNLNVISVTIPGSVTNIGNNAFQGTGLGIVAIGTNIINIGNSAFQFCRVSTLNFVSGPVTGLLNIGTNAFAYCVDLTGIVNIPNSVTNLADGAFYMSHISNLTLGTNLVCIGSNTFYGCSSLTTLSLPASVQHIGGGAFDECGGLGGIYFNGTNLNTIGNNAFEDCYKLTSLGLPSSLSSIGASAFQGCSGLTGITIPINVTNLGANAFANCTGLSGINFAATNLINLGAGAFSYCTKLTSVFIPTATTNIGAVPFLDCSKILSLNVSSSNPAFSASGGVLFNKNQTVLFEFPAGYDGGPPGSYTIPSTVTSIAPSAFNDCLTLGKVTLPNTVTNLGDSAFNDCNLTNMTLPHSVFTIGNYCFAGCSLLNQFSFGSGAINIGNFAFSGCGLTSVTIPNSVTNIGEAPFAYSRSLTNIAVAAGNPGFSSVSGVLFDNNQTLLIQYPGGLSASSYAVPASVISIGGYAFDDCYLNNISLPNGLGSIGEFAFAGSTLTNIVFRAAMTSIGDYAFDGCYELLSAYFQGNAPPDDGTVFFFSAGPKVYYLPGTMNWNATFGGAPTALWLPQAVTGDGSFGVQSNQFGFNLNWAGGQTVVVEASTDLISWQPVETNTLATDTAYFSDPQWTNYPTRYYRIQSAQ